MPDQDGRARWRRILPPVLGATMAAFLLDLLLSPPGSVLEVVARAVLFPLGAWFFFLVGWWLGTHTWPKRGKRLGRWMLAHSARRDGRMLFLTDRPDFPPSIARRVLEVVGFSAGSSVILASAFILMGLRDAAAIGTLAASFTLVTLWASFLIVPYWLFGRLGLRQIDLVRWMIQPMSRRYASRLRLSNGALLLIALGVLVNVAFRAGLSGDEALVNAFRALAGVVYFVLIAAGTGVGYYSIQERRLLREMEAETLAMGIRDGRGMSDNDFLPRLPPTAPAEHAQEASQ